ncbi:MAG: sugar ABC transporter ATP-binding protein [Lachnospiraceae bacterium]|nr:sugar ABC transporter ATP-binding protein [Lachnospiraceae bacterium]
MAHEVILEAKNIVKNFGLTHALKDVSFDIRRGEIIGLIGENGSGKSTFSSIISGVYPPTSGSMKLEGETYKPTSILDAQNHGISMIAQEMGTLASIRVADNIFLGKEQLFTTHGVVNKKKMYSEAQKAIDKVGIKGIDPKAPTSKYSFEDRKLIEVVRALYSEPDIFIVDETTTALSQSGREVIYRIIREFQANNRTVLFISHDLEELMSICTQMIVLRDGNFIRALERDEFDEALIKELMVGRKLDDNYYRSDYDPTFSDEVVLRTKDLHVKGSLNGVSLELHKGEILGIGGLTDCGMHDLGKAVYGGIKPVWGEVTLGDGTKITSEKQAMEHHIGYVSKNRDQESVILTSSILDNLVLPSFKSVSKAGLIFKLAEKKFSKGVIDQMSIKCSSPMQDVGDLSGGNKQKVAFGKWLGNDSQIFILDCPTRGIDIGVKAAMYQLMYKLKKEGKAILMISEELPELIGMSDRILIMKDGQVKKCFDRSPELTESELIKEML